MKVVIAGGSGLIGTGLIPALSMAGHEVVRLVRRRADGRDEIGWDPGAGELDVAALEGVEGFINLAGTGIADKRWTDERKAEIVQSRVRTTTLLAGAAAKLDPLPKAFLGGSAVGFYGYDGGDTVKSETSPRGDGFLADVCVEWEAATGAASGAGIRTVLLRTGIVQSAAGGALAKQLPLFKLGAGGKIGSGRQWVPWMSLHDEVHAIVRCLVDESLSGPVNLTAPTPVTNAEFTRTLGSVLRRPTVVPVPTPALKLLLGPQLVDEALLGGVRATPQRLEDVGFAFRHRSLEVALRDILGK